MRGRARCVSVALFNHVSMCSKLRRHNNKSGKMEKSPSGGRGEGKVFFSFLLSRWRCWCRMCRLPTPSLRRFFSSSNFHACVRQRRQEAPHMLLTPFNRNSRFCLPSFPPTWKLCSAIETALNFSWKTLFHCLKNYWKVSQWKARKIVQSSSQLQAHFSFRSRFQLDGIFTVQKARKSSRKILGKSFKEFLVEKSQLRRKSWEERKTHTESRIFIIHCVCVCEFTSLKRNFFHSRPFVFVRIEAKVRRWKSFSCRFF